MTNFLIGDISCNLYFNGDQAVQNIPNNTACVFLMHGRTGQKEDLEDLATQISEAGSLCITFDHPNHGTRKQDPAKNNSWTKQNFDHAFDMHAQILRSVRDVSYLIDYLPIKLNFKTNKFAVAGISQGGHAAFMSITHESRISCCVGFISSTSYKTSLKYKYEKLKKHYAKHRKGEAVPEFKELYSDDFSEFVDRMDPIFNMEKMLKEGRYILMLNGGADRLVTNDSNLEFMAKMKELYGNKFDKYVKHITYEGVKHEVPEEMRSEGVYWLAEHFINSADSNL
eukprot:snap_masked-scaffold_4-processed-gene-7.29-mRNA-1 protein AED:1.00 eAED:1.00 QI:0/-1/0/0/-1/1/1/0/282